MKSWEQIKLGTSTLIDVKKLVKQKENYNPGCKLITYWDDRMNNKIEKQLMIKKCLPYGYVGSGWPYALDQSWVIPFDRLGLRSEFQDEDFNTRDVGDTIYQTNVLLSYFEGEKHIGVMDFGSGYGRLAVGFILGTAKMGMKLAYFGIDYVPVSLVIAPQFVYQTTLSNADGLFYRRDHGNGRYFHSVPAWEVEKIRVPIDLFITIHSFQEMTQEAVRFYVEIAERMKTKDAMFYSVNIEQNYNWIPSTWEGVFVKEYPSVNRDGVFYEKLWRMNK